MPTIEDLKFEIRDSGTREKLFAIEAVEVDADPEMLLQYLKNEFTQKEILNSLEDYVEHSVAFEDAQESVNLITPASASRISSNPSSGIAKPAALKSCAAPTSRPPATNSHTCRFPAVRTIWSSPIRPTTK
jgi:hypothetical protein